MARSASGRRFAPSQSPRSAGAERILQGITANLPLKPGGVREEVHRQYFAGILTAHNAAVAARRAEAEAAAADAHESPDVRTNR